MSESTITMIDYGGSNLRSVQKAFEAVGADVVVTADPDVVRRATKLVLPGVGAFGAGMEALRRRGLDEATIAAVGDGIPLLGICLGMQFLLDGSEEMGDHTGLGLIPGQVVRFPEGVADDDNRPLKVPHVGWNRILHDGRHPLLAGVPTGAYGYFVHSFYCAPEATDCVLAETDYGGRFASIIGSGHRFGIQFHPEKSQSVGLQILRNFASMKVGAAYGI
jgi:imidazole glycerol-phosphate synthase subunit HisH